MKNTKDLLEHCEQVAIYKTSSSFKKTAILAFFAGLYIALGALASLMLSASFKDNYSLSKLLSALIFPVGLMLVLIAGGELFTGNCLIIEGLFTKKISFKKFLNNLTIVWLFNFLGALFIVLLVLYSHLYNDLLKDHIITNALNKTHYSFLQIILKGIGCNILVAAAVFISYSTKDTLGKLFCSFFPIMLFIILGFDHCVANMFYLPMAYFLGGDLNISAMMTNIIAATIGNMIGGCLVLVYLYHQAYKNNDKNLL